MGYPDSGHLLWVDEYGTVFENYWETIEVGGKSLLDITSIVKTPHVWCEPDEGYIQNKIVFRRGICSTTRDVILMNDDGYEIIASGSTSVVCTFQASFNCGDIPRDPFKYHLDAAVNDEIDNMAVCGSRWHDVENQDEVTGTECSVPTWPIVNNDGSIVDNGYPLFEFMSVW